MFGKLLLGEMLLGELTVAWEERIEEVHERNLLLYEELRTVRRDTAAP